MSDSVKSAHAAAPQTELPAPSADLLHQAIALLQGERQPSISYLQRHLRLGYRAALGLRKALEEQGHVQLQGIINPADKGDPKR